jgi:hypothetical protein
MHKQFKMRMKRNQKENNNKEIGATEGTNPDVAGKVGIRNEAQTALFKDLVRTAQ